MLHRRRHHPSPPQSRARVGRPREDSKNQENWDRSPEMPVSEGPPPLVAVPTPAADAAGEATARPPMVVLAVGVA